MSDLSIGFSISQSEAAEVSRLIQMRAGYLREDMYKSTGWAAYYIARAAGASTAQAPKKRKLIMVPTSIGTNAGVIFVKKYYALRSFRNGVKIAGAINSGSGYLVPMIGVFKSKDATTHPSRNIAQGKGNKRGGLAKRSWLWMLGKIDTGGYTNQGTSKGAVATVKVGKDSDGPSIVLHNKLGYAAMAFKADKENTIISRGLNAFRKDLERRSGISVERR